MKFIKKLFKKKSNSNIAILIIIAALFGLAGGIAGQIFSNSYLSEAYYNVPYLGEVNLKNGAPNGALIIRDARKVVVEQDDKIQETINSSKQAIVGIFRKKVLLDNEEKFDVNNYYKLDEDRGQGIVITSDGWILTSAFSPNIRTNTDIMLNYVVITNDKKIYEIDKVIRDPLSNFGFIHTKDVRNLNVAKFDQTARASEGLQVIGVNWQGESFISQVLNSDKNKQSIQSSDAYKAIIALTSALPDSFKGAPIFDLSGNIVAAVDNNGNIEQFNNYIAEANSLLKYGNIRKAKLGVYYINLSDYIIKDKDYEKGALITKNAEGVAVEKNSPAEIAGLKEGDIVLSVDNIELNSNIGLNQAIQRYLAGDIVNLVYYRKGEKSQAKIQLSISN